MRIRFGAFFACAVVGCSVNPGLPAPACHHHSRDCGSDAIRSRVLESFSSAKFEEILACADEPALFCSSASTDEEACIVRAGPDALGAYRSNDVHDSSTPPLVLKLFRDLGERQVPDRMFHRQVPGPYGEPRHESVFTNPEGTLAVLYVAEVRCIDITEIT